MARLEKQPRCLHC